MQQELQIARHQAATNNADGSSTTTSPPSGTGASSPVRSSAHSAVVAAAAVVNFTSATEAERQRAAKLEKALYCAEEMRAAVEFALQEAEDRREAAEDALKEAEERLAAVRVLIVLPVETAARGAAGTGRSGRGCGCEGAILVSNTVSTVGSVHISHLWRGL